MRAGTTAGLLILAAVGTAACGASGGGDERARAEPSPLAPRTAAPPAGVMPPPATAPAPASAHPKRAPSGSLERLIGQTLVVSFRAHAKPPAALIRRIEQGRVGGVILFGENVPAGGAGGVRATVRRLRAAALRGGNPPLLVATDQEGGDVRRMPGPPLQSPRQLGRLPPEEVRAVGAQTGRGLRSLGVDLDLAPVTDLALGDSFLGSRTFSTDPSRNAAASVAFADGLQRSGVAAAAKHYPGLGSSGQASTDVAVVVLDTPRAVLERERRAFLRHVAAGTRVVMVSNASYNAYDPGRPAAISRKIIGRLRDDGFGGVVISDDLAVPALRPLGARLAGAATNAGVDLLLFASNDGASAASALIADVRAGRVRRSTVERHVQRIIALKRWIARRSR